MFRGSVPFLFRPMPTIKKFKIHPPLPLNPRESKQLLNLLTTSFRQQLDTAHGFRTDQELPTSQTKQHHNGRERKRSHSDPVIRPTDLHLSSVLTNPLLSGAPDEHRPLWTKDPMTVFHIAEAKGLMDLKLARHCLSREKNRIIQSSVLSVQQGMKESGAGLKVLRWLVASGLTEDNTFLENRQFAEVFMEFIVAEELQEIAWKWIKRAFEEFPRYATLTNVSEKQLVRRDLVTPLMDLIKAEAHASNNLDSAYLCLSRAAGYLKGKTSSQMMVILGPPGNFLSHLTNITPPDLQPPSESAFDSFLGLIPVISKNTEYHFAHLNLRHPSRPSAESALSYLKKLDSLPTLQDPKLMVSRAPPQRNLIELGLNTAKFLLEKERFDDADWVMKYLQSRFPEQLGVQGRKTLERAKAEASSLQLLEGLNFA